MVKVVNFMLCIFYFKKKKRETKNMRFGERIPNYTERSILLYILQTGNVIYLITDQMILECRL